MCKAIRVSVRFTVNGVMLRLFAKRPRAMVRAGQLTISTGQQHRDVRTPYGYYIVRNDVTGEYLDENGPIPRALVAKLLEPFDWGSFPVGPFRKPKA